MKNVHRDENSPVEIIEGRLKRLHTNETDARNRLRLREEEGGHWKDQAEHELKLDSDMASAMAWRAYLAAARRGGGRN